MSQETDDGVENVTEESQETQKKIVSTEEFNDVKSELEFLKNQLVQQNTAREIKQEAQAQTITPEQLQQFQANPALLAGWLKAQTEQAKNEIRSESQKELWDKRAEEKFPLIKTDKIFAQKVSQQIREFTQNGEYKKNDPMLVYRAAQIVSTEYAPKPQQSPKNYQTSAEGRTSTVRESSGGKTKIDDNDPRMQFAKLLGITGPKLEKFKSQLGPYVEPQRKQGRRLSK